MTRKEKSQLADIIASWEWRGYASSSVAYAAGIHVKELQEAFPLDDETLAISRAMEIITQAGHDTNHDDDTYDALLDAVCEKILEDYSEVANHIDNEGFEGFVNSCLAV
jgi:hypothetical protein